MSAKTETRTTLVSDFHDFRLECAANRIILFCSLQIDNRCIIINNISHFVGQLVFVFIIASSRVSGDICQN